MINMNGSTAEDFGLTREAESYRTGHNNATKYAVKQILLSSLAWIKVYPEDKKAVVEYSQYLIKRLEGNDTEVL